MGVLCLTCRVGVQWLEIHCAAGLARLPCTNYHSVTPSDWRADWDWLDHPGLVPL